MEDCSSKLQTSKKNADATIRAEGPLCQASCRQVSRKHETAESEREMTKKWWTAQASELQTSRKNANATIRVEGPLCQVGCIQAVVACKRERDRERERGRKGEIERDRERGRWRDDENANTRPKQQPYLQAKGPLQYVKST